MPSPEAQRVFDEFLERVRRGDAPALEALCADHPALARELRGLHSSWLEATLVESSFFRRLQKTLGNDVDPGISLDREPAAGVGGGDDTRLLLERVASMSAESRYSIKGELARGGMGMIYKVWDRDLRRTLAMKVVLGRDGAKDGSSGSVDRDRLGRFLEEAQITGQLDHPGIVPVHEMGLDPDGRVFFTMRLVKGKELREILEEYHQGVSGGTLTRAVQLIIKVCDAVAYAHDKGVVHRDLKPANVMIGRFGEVYVMDWGLAKVIGREERAADASSLDVMRTLVGTDRAARSGSETLEGAVFGTPCYMAPEQARGQLDRIGPWSDIYAVGAILYHLLTGRMPYVPPGEHLEPHAILAQLLHGPPTPIHECNPSVPGELVAVCEKAMQREPSARYASLIKMKEDLQAWLEGRVVQAYETGAVAEFRKWVARNRGMAAALAGLVLVLVGGASGIAWLQVLQTRRIAEKQRETETARESAEANAREASRQSYVANLIAADVHLRGGEVLEAKRRLSACDPSLRGWEWRHVALKADSSLATLEHPEAVLAVAAAPALFRVATGSSDFVVRLWDPASGELAAALTGHTGAVGSLAFSPDGSRLVSGSEDGSARVWDVASGRTLHVLREHEATVAGVAWDGARGRIVSAGRDQHVRVWDADTGDELLDLAAGDQPVEAVAVAPDGALIAAGTSDGRVTLWSSDEGGLPRELEGHAAKVTWLAFDPAGERLASASMDGSVVVRDVQSGALLLELVDRANPVFCLAFDPPGERLVTGSLDKALRFFDAGSGEELAVLHGHEEPVRGIAFADDGARLVSAADDGTARLWAADVGAATTRLALLDEPVAALAVASDGARLAFGTRFTGAIGVWDASSATQLFEAPALDDGVVGLAFAPDGTWLVAGLEDGASLHVLDARSGEPRLQPMLGHGASVAAVAIAPGGARVASASADGSVRLWDARTGRAERVLEGHEAPVTSVVFSPDGTRVLAGAMNGEVRAWDAASGAPGLTLQAHAEPLQAVALSPDGQLLASGSLDGSVRLWRADDGAPRGVLEGHGGAVYALAFDPDGSRLVSASFDKTLLIWDCASGEALLALRGHEGPVVTAAFSADGTSVVSSALDGSVIVWETAPPSTRFLARQAARLVESRLAQLQSLPAVRASLESDPALDEELRAEALRHAALR